MAGSLTNSQLKAGKVNPKKPFRVEYVTESSLSWNKHSEHKSLELATKEFIRVKKCPGAGQYFWRVREGVSGEVVQGPDGPTGK